MDKARTTKNRWAWVPEAMPGVARLIADHKKRLGDAWVNECWKRSVIDRQPGWLFAREGPLTIGTPWDTPELANFAALNVTATQALLVIKTPEVKHGADS